MTYFADALTTRIETTNSIVVAGFDPKLEDMPAFLKLSPHSKSQLTPDQVILRYAELSFAVLKDRVPAVKPNIAFFEQYGIAGLRAFSEVLKLARSHNLLSIADAKRGDIGSTAEAYSNAFLSEGQDFSADALTVNPFLGLETLEPFITNCEKFSKGLFVLVKTSNPDAKGLQGSAADATSVSAKLCRHLSQNAARLLGDCNLSGLGAVVGATHPDEAREIRNMVPHNYFLIPGYGAQGGKALDALAGFAKDARGKPAGGIVNVSRGLFAAVKNSSSEDDFQTKLQESLNTINADLNQARDVQ